MAGTLALGLAFVLLLAWDLWSIKRELDAGQATIDELTLEAAASTGVATLADDAADHLEAAADRAHGSLPLRALSLLPYVEDQVTGMRRMADVGATLGQAGRRAALHLDERLEGASEPAGRIELLDVALDELDAIEQTLGGIDLGPATGLLPPLRDAHDDLADALRRAKAKLRDGRELIAPVRRLLEGPTSLLLLAANNAEMTGGAGMTLSAGILTFEGGDFQLSEVVPARLARLEATLPIPDHISEIYGVTGVGVDLRSTTRSPDLATMGPIALDIMAEHGFTDLAGVVVVDALALRDLMALTGPVTVGDQEITPETVVAEVLHENYLEYRGPRAERYDHQGDIAKAVFESLTTSGASAMDIARTLLDTSRGRHLLLWAEDDDLHAVWEELEVDGALDPTGLLIAFQNYGADKLDWYLQPSADLDVSVLPSGDFRARLAMRMPTPSMAELSDASPYILGANPGVHGLFLTVHLPKAAYDITTPDAGGFRTIGEEPPMQVRSFLADVPLGSTFERTIEFSLPRSSSWMTLLPSARIEPLSVEVDDVATVTDAEPTGITWLAALPPAPASGAPSPWVRIPVLLGLAGTLAATAAVALTAARRRALAGPVPSFVPALAASALACFAVAATLAMILAWSSPRL